jgi:ubiquinone/menaquinone biosynthesis C-methylase UbiE
MVAIEMAKQHPNILIDAIDLSAGMLAQAKYKASAEGIQNITFIQGDVEALPYNNGTFDVITCGYGMFFYPQMEHTYQQLCQKLKEGGVIIFSSFTQEAFAPYVTLFLQRLEMDYQIEIPKVSMARLKTEPQMRALAELSHPSNIEIEQHTIRYPVTVDQWWDMLNSAGYKGLINQLDLAQLIQFKQRHLAELAALATNGTFELNADTLFSLVRL